MADGQQTDTTAQESTLRDVPFPLVVDFGTSTTIAATATGLQDLAPRYYPAEEPEPTMLLFESVAAPEEPQYTIGHNARSKAFAYPKATVASVKKLIGREGAVPIAAIDGSTAEYTPDQLARMFLSKFMEDALRHFGWWPSRIVCTYPRTFSPAQVQVLAGLVGDVVQMAGARFGATRPVPVETLYDEANATALYSLVAMLEELRDRFPDPAAHLDLMRNRSIVAFDVGGGTTDYVRLSVSLHDPVSANGDCVKPSLTTRIDASSGDFEFGGDMITSSVIYLIKDKVEGQLPDGGRIHCARSDDAADWRANFFSLFPVAESVKIRLSAGEPRVLLRDVLSELPGALRVTKEGVEESWDLGRLSGVVAELAIERTEVDAVVRPYAERNVETLMRLCQDRPVDVVMLAGNGVQYPLFGELFLAQRAKILKPHGRLLSSREMGKKYVATGAYQALVNNAEAFRLIDLFAAKDTATVCGDYYFLTSTGKIAHTRGLTQPIIAAGAPFDPERGVVFDSGDGKSPARYPVGTFMIGRRLHGQRPEAGPVPIQLFYPPPMEGGEEPAPRREIPRAGDGREQRWDVVRDVVRAAHVELGRSLDTLGKVGAPQDEPRIRHLRETFGTAPELRSENDAALVRELTGSLRNLLDTYNMVARLKEMRRIRYRKVKLRTTMVDKLRVCLDLVAELGVPEPAPAPVESASTGGVRSAWYKVALRPDLSLEASYRTDRAEVRALTTGTPSAFYERASVFDWGTRPFERP